MVDPQAAGQLAGAAGRPVGGVVHAGDGRGCPGRRPRNIGAGMPSRPAVAAPAVPADGGRDQRRPRHRLRQRAGRRARRGPPLRLRRPVRPAQGRRAGRRPGEAGHGRPPGAHWSSSRAPRPTSPRRRLGHAGARSTAGRSCADVRPAAADRGVDHGARRAARATRWNAALDRRGIVDRSLVQIDPWPAGTFGLAPREGPAHHAVPGLPARVRTTTATPARSRA